MHAGGIAWRKQGGGKIIDVDKADIARVTWMKVPRAYQLGVRLKDGLFYKFIGFREQVLVLLYLTKFRALNSFLSFLILFPLIYFGSGKSSCVCGYATTSSL